MSAEFQAVLCDELWLTYLKRIIWHQRRNLQKIQQ